MPIGIAAYFFTLVAATVYAALSWPRLSISFKLLGAAIWITLISESYTRWRFLLDPELPASYGIYSPVYFALLIGVYTSLFRGNAQRWFARILLVVVLVKGIALLCFYSLAEFPIDSLSFEILALIACSLLGFFEMLRQPADLQLSKNPVFWLNAAVLCYWSFAYMRMGNLPEYLQVFHQSYTWFELLHTWMSVLYYALLIFILYLAAQLHPHAARH